MRSFGIQFSQFVDKYMFLLTPGALLLGFLFAPLLQPAIGAIPYLFGYSTFVMAMGCGVGHVRQVFRKPGLMLLTLGLAHLLSPIIAYLLGSAVFGAHSPYVVGMVLFTVIPLGVSSVIWVGLSQGSVPLILALVVLDSALSPLVVPHSIDWMFGQMVSIDTGGVMLDLIWIVVLPTVIGVAVHELSNGQAKTQTAPFMLPTSKLAFLAVILLNASAIAPYVKDLSQDMMKLVPMVILLVAICYGVGAVGSRWLMKESLDPALQVTVAYATGMRNISLGIVIAMGYFTPQASIPVVLSILIQQPMATAFHALHKILTLRRLAKKGMSRYDKR